MLNILFVEDDENKARQIRAFLETEFKKITLSLEKSYHSGMKALFTGNVRYDLLLLDMSMPTHDRTPGDMLNSFMHYAGRDMLHEMYRTDALVKTIVVTQFGVFGEGREQIDAKQLSDELAHEFPEAYLGMVHYNASLSNWKAQLSQLIRDNVPVERADL